MLREFHRCYPWAFVTQHPLYTKGSHAKLSGFPSPTQKSTQTENQWLWLGCSKFKIGIHVESVDTVDTQLLTHNISPETWQMPRQVGWPRVPPLTSKHHPSKHPTIKPSPHSQKSWKLLVFYRFSTQINPWSSVATCMLTRLESLRGHRCAKVCIFAASWASPARSKASWVDGRTGGNMKREKFHGNHILGLRYFKVGKCKDKLGRYAIHMYIYIYVHLFLHVYIQHSYIRVSSLPTWNMDIA